MRPNTPSNGADFVLLIVTIVIVNKRSVCYHLFEKTNEVVYVNNKIVLTTPADSFIDGLPIGNGRIAAMLLGGDYITK